MAIDIRFLDIVAFSGIGLFFLHRHIFFLCFIDIRHRHTPYTYAFSIWRFLALDFFLFFLYHRFDGHIARPPAATLQVGTPLSLSK